MAIAPRAGTSCRVRADGFAYSPTLPGPPYFTRQFPNVLYLQKFQDRDCKKVSIENFFGGQKKTRGGILNKSRTLLLLLASWFIAMEKRSLTFLFFFAKKRSRKFSAKNWKKKNQERIFFGAVKKWSLNVKFLWSIPSRVPSIDNFCSIHHLNWIRLSFFFFRSFCWFASPWGRLCLGSDSKTHCKFQTHSKSPRLKPWQA